jgi:hypothetical protein
VSPKQAVVVVCGGILRAILQALTRYSANVPQFPVNDRSPVHLRAGHREVSCSPRSGAADGPGLRDLADGECGMPMMAES